MAIWSVGSIRDHITNIIGTNNIPSSISGTTMSNMIEQAINHANNFTNDNIGITNIAAKYQPAIIDLSLSKVLASIESQEGGIDSAKLGPLSLGQGKGGNIELSKDYWIKGEKALRELGRHVRFTRVIGGS